MLQEQHGRIFNLIYMSYQEEIQNLNIQISSLHAEEKEKISQEPDVEKHAGKIDAINKQIADLIVKEMEENILNAKRVNDLLQTVWTKSMIMKLTDIEVLELFGVF